MPVSLAGFVVCDSCKHEKIVPAIMGTIAKQMNINIQIPADYHISKLSGLVKCPACLLAEKAPDGKAAVNTDDVETPTDRKVH